jgi:hypothetical protein
MLDDYSPIASSIPGRLEIGRNASTRKSTADAEPRHDLKKFFARFF